MKTLVVVAHPDLTNSKVNSRWIKELAKYPEKYTVHKLYEAYPDFSINIEKEQKLIEEHDTLILQFPIQWFNSPPLLKKWLDDVFSYGWAYGKSGDNLKDKIIALAVSAGIRESDYTINGRYQHTLEEMLLPFKTTFFYCGAQFHSLFAYYGKEGSPGGTGEKAEVDDEQLLAKNAEEYIQFLDSLSI